MWALICILACIIPPILSSIVGVFFKVRVWLICLLLAVMLVIAIIPINAYMNAKHDPEGRYREGLYLTTVTGHSRQRFTGPYSWRFFVWGVLEGDGNPTSLQYKLRDAGVSPDLAQKMDITNPTPCHIFSWLLLLALISFFLKSKNGVTVHGVAKDVLVELNEELKG